MNFMYSYMNVFCFIYMSFMYSYILLFYSCITILGGESSSSVHDAQYFDDIIGEHVYKPDVPVQLIPFKGLIFKS